MGLWERAKFIWRSYMNADEDSYDYGKDSDETIDYDSHEDINYHDLESNSDKINREFEKLMRENSGSRPKPMTRKEREELANAFKTLRIKQTKTLDLEKVKKHYRKLMIKYHPDRNKDKRAWAEKKCAAMNEAYDVLVKHFSGKGRNS